MNVSRISCATDSHPLPGLAHANWISAEDVSVSFDIHHRGTSILLKYLVEEPQVRAINTDFNSSVWEDSCVEFFISLDGDDNYYNFEFNAIGAVLGAYGPNRKSREFISHKILEHIHVDPSLGRAPIKNREGKISWELAVILPLKAFCYHELTDISGHKARANFYKCGDSLKKPHFLSWKPVLAEKPDFHRPEFFGDLEFSS